MPQWLAGVVAAFLGQWFQTIFRKKQYIHEKLLERYSEFVGVTSEELRRAKYLMAGIALYDSRDESQLPKLAELENRRHELAKELNRRSLQMRLLERDQDLGQMVAGLAEAQPFQPILVPPQPGLGNYNERSELFRKEIHNFKEKIDLLVQAILKKYVDNAI